MKSSRPHRWSLALACTLATVLLVVWVKREKPAAPPARTIGQDARFPEPAKVPPVDETALDRSALERVTEVRTVVHGTASTEFYAWAAGYFAAAPVERPKLTRQGTQLAEARRAEFKRLIVENPEQALAEAVPMVVRQRLPEPVLLRLERRLSGRGPLDVQAISPDSAPSEPLVRRFITLAGEEFRAHVYGTRSASKSAPEIMVNGVAVDREFAVAQEPIRRLEPGEIPDPGKTPIQFCPVSKKATTVPAAPNGALPPITEETPAVEAGGEIIYLCDGGHFRQLAADILEREAQEGGTGGPVAGTGAFPVGRTASTGVRKMLYMRVVFPDRLSESQTEAAAYANVKTLTDYFQEQSYGRLTFLGTVTPTLILPRTEAWYILDYNTTGSNSPILADAKEAARAAGFPPEDFQHYTVIYAGGPGSFGGLGSVNGSSAWLKTTAVGTFEHEIGHNLGVWHSNSWNTSGASVIGPGANVEYGHIKDVMGSSGSGGHFNASMKEQLQWMLAENYHTVIQSGTYRLFQFDQANEDPARRYALKVAKDADRDYWLEFRQKFTTNPWWMNGATVNWSPWGVGNGATNTTTQGSNLGPQLLDTTPGTPDNLEDAPVVIGRTFSDFEAGIHITPIGKGGTAPESLDVVVNVGAFAGNQPPTLELNADNPAIAAGGTVNFTATATDPEGDTLAYYWEFGDKQASYSGSNFSNNNAPTQAKGYSTAGYYAVRCTASDRKGGSVTKTLMVTVGTPSTFTLSGIVIDGEGAPVRDVRISNGSTGTSQRSAYTDSDGYYLITNLAAGSVTLSGLKGNDTYTAAFANPVTVGPSKTDLNFSMATGVTVSIEAVDPSASELGDIGFFRLTRTGDTATALTVCTDFSGTATLTSDYVLSPAATIVSPLESFTIPAGSASLDIIVTPVSDTNQEGPETVVMSLINGGAYVPTGLQTATVTIEDDDTTKPRVTVTASIPETIEGGATAAQFTVTRTGSAAAPLIVSYSFGAYQPTATIGTDFVAPGTTTIPAGAASAAIDISPIDDSLAEGPEFVTLNVSSNTSVIAGVPGSATVKINDNDLNVVTLAATDATANENGDTGTFTFTRTGSTTLPLTVYYAVGGSAMHGVDYQALPGSVVFAAGSSTATVTIVPINDNWGEPAQTVILQIRSALQYQFSGAGNATVTLNDDGDLPVVSIAASAAQAVEGGTGGSFLFTTTGTGSGNITVRYTVSGTATSGADFTPLSGTVTMAKNTTSSLGFAVINDTIPEDMETLILTITPDAAYTVDLQKSATINIRDNDAANMVSVSTTSTAVSETLAGKFYFSRSGVTTGAITVNYAVSGSATPGDDYAALTGSVVIAAGSSGTYVDVTPVNDTLAEGTETVVVTLLPDTVAPATYGIEVGSATMSIGDNDTGFTGNLGFALASVVKTEDAGTFNIDVIRTGNTTGPVSVEYGVQAGTALGNGVDYRLPPGRLDFAAGEVTKPISLSLVDDSVSEDVETVVLQLRNANGAAITGTGAQFTCMIVDNEPRVTVEATDAFAYETGNNPATFTFRRYGSTVGALAVPFTVSGTATSGVDFVSLGTSVTIPAGASSASLTLTPLADGVTESAETVVVSLANSSNALPGPAATATASIGDAQTNNPPFIQFVSPKTSAVFVPAGVGLSIDASVEDETAPAISWTRQSGPGTVVFSAPTQADTDVTFSASGTHVLRLTATDGVNTSTSDLTVTVGAASLPWTDTDIGTVTLPGSATERNGLHAANGSGTSLGSTADSLFLRSRHLVGDGEIRARVRYVPDTSGARVGVMLRESNATGARMAAMMLTPVFTNSESFLYRGTTGAAASTVTTTGIAAGWWVRVVRAGNSFSAYDSPDGATWTQRGTSQTLAMGTDILAGLAVMSGNAAKLNTALFDNVRIIGTQDNTAANVSAGSDGTTLINTALPINGTANDDALPSLPGATTVQWSQTSGPGAATFTNSTSLQASVKFPVAGNYVLRLTADDGEVRTYDQASFTVTAPTVTIVADDASATEEGFGTGHFIVTRTGVLTSPLTVRFTPGGTATEAVDYQSLGGQLIIPAGSASVGSTVTALADNLAEGDESVVITLAADASYLVGNPAAATITLADSPVDAWRFAQFGAEANNPLIGIYAADPDHDGFSNLLEWSLGTSATSPGPAPITHDIETIGEQRFLRMSVVKNPSATGVEFSIEGTSDLEDANSWSTTGLLIEENTGTSLRVRDTIPLGDVPSRYLRLRVSKP